MDSAPLEFIYNYVDRDTFKKYFRLTIIVCIYVIARGYYANYAKTQQVKRQIAQDNADKQREKDQAVHAERIDNAQKELSAVEKQNQGFGWGKATRRKVKAQEQVVKLTEEQLRERQQSEYDAAEDHDIEEYLE